MTVKAVDITCTLRCKVAVCGNAAVGKTALISMFSSKGQKFPKEYKMTTGAEVVVSQVQVPDTTTAVELYLIDTAGSELYQDQVPSYWNGAYFAILVFDISNQESFAACRSWYDLLKQSRTDRDRPLKVVLVATKTDLPLARHQIRLEAAQDYAAQNSMDFFDVEAAQPGKNVEAPFMAIATAYHKLYEDRRQACVDSTRNY